jgi:hypothetical protein
MQILEDDPGGIGGFDMFEETSHGGMRGLGRISIGSVHARGIGGIEFPWMQILEDNSGGIGGFDMFEETLDVGMRGIGRISIGSMHARGIGGIGIL